jgi:ferredoxin-type protein NapH
MHDIAIVGALEIAFVEEPAMVKQQATRQRIRKATILVSLLLLPITLNYFSPYVIIDGASQSIINGSFIVFVLLFLSSLLLGRLWCAWLCPAAGIQEACFPINAKSARGGKFDWIKWGIWIPWVSIIAVAAISGGGYHTVNFFHLTDSGISVDQPSGYIVYYVVVGTFLILSLTAGRRGGCHYICWMAPFMIIGRTARNLVKWPAFRLEVDRDKCIDCMSCTKNCPMSLDVNQMVQREDMENGECILCASCIDVCPESVITYSFSSG